MKISEFLARNPEPMPEWLARFRVDDPFPIEDFLASRVVFYPGSGLDGHPVKLFGSSCSAHSFVYADYRLPQEVMETEIVHPTDRFLGYQTLAMIPLGYRTRATTHPPMHFDEEIDDQLTQGERHTDPYRLAAILERDKEFADNHGPSRLAIFFVGANAITAYTTLFCGSINSRKPFAIAVENHSEAVDNNSFGGGGPLEAKAREHQMLPDWLLVAEGTDPWDGYSEVPDVDGERGGMNNSLRRLYQPGV